MTTRRRDFVKLAMAGAAGALVPVSLKAASVPAVTETAIKTINGVAPDVAGALTVTEEFRKAADLEAAVLDFTAKPDHLMGKQWIVTEKKLLPDGSEHVKLQFSAPVEESPAGISIPFDSLPSETVIFGAPRDRLRASLTKGVFHKVMFGLDFTSAVTSSGQQKPCTVLERHSLNCTNDYMVIANYLNLRIVQGNLPGMRYAASHLSMMQQLRNTFERLHGQLAENTITLAEAQATLLNSFFVPKTDEHNLNRSVDRPLGVRYSFGPQLSPALIPTSQIDFADGRKHSRLTISIWQRTPQAGKIERHHCVLFVDFATDVSSPDEQIAADHSRSRCLVNGKLESSGDLKVLLGKIQKQLAANAPTFSVSQYEALERLQTATHDLIDAMDGEGQDRLDRAIDRFLATVGAKSTDKPEHPECLARLRFYGPPREPLGETKVVHSQLRTKLLIQIAPVFGELGKAATPTLRIEITPAGKEIKTTRVVELALRDPYAYRNASEQVAAMSYGRHEYWQVLGHLGDEHWTELHKLQRWCHQKYAYLSDQLKLEECDMLTGDDLRRWDKPVIVLGTQMEPYGQPVGPGAPPLPLQAGERVTRVIEGPTPIRGKKGQLAMQIKLDRNLHQRNGDRWLTVRIGLTHCSTSQQLSEAFIARARNRRDVDRVQRMLQEFADGQPFIFQDRLYAFVPHLSAIGRMLFPENAPVTTLSALRNSAELLQRYVAGELTWMDPDPQYEQTPSFGESAYNSLTFSRDELFGGGRRTFEEGLAKFFHRHGRPPQLLKIDHVSVKDLLKWTAFDFSGLTTSLPEWYHRLERGLDGYMQRHYGVAVELLPYVKDAKNEIVLL